MNFQHPSLHDIATIHAAIHSDEEEEDKHSRPRHAKPVPSQDMPSDELPPGPTSYIFAEFVFFLVATCILLVFLL